MQVRVFYQNLTSNSDFSNFIIKDEKIIHYLKNVLRLQKLAQVFVFNESSELRCAIEAIDKKFVQFSVLEYVEKSEKLSKLTVFLPILKRDKLSFLISSITQLGVENVIFYTSQHSSNSDKINFEKLELNMIESLEQCRGFTKTKIHKDIVKLKDIPKMSKDSILHIAYEKFLDPRVSKNDKNTNKFLLIGPEGGFLESEINFLISEQKCEFLNLGKRILRAEMAAIVAVAKLMD